MAVLHGHADDAARSREDLLAVLVREVAHLVVLVHEGQLDWKRVENRGHDVALDAERQVLDAASADDPIGEAVVLGARALPDGGFGGLDAGNDRLPVGRAHHSAGHRVEDVVLLPEVALHQRRVLGEHRSQLVQHAGVPADIGVDQRGEPGQQHAVLLVLHEHDGEWASAARNAALLDQREQVVLFLLVVAAVHVLPQVPRRVPEQAPPRLAGPRQRPLHGLEHLLGRLMIGHQQVRPWLRHHRLQKRIYFLAGAEPATCWRTLSTLRWNTNSGSALSALVVKLYCLPPRFLMRRFFFR